MEKYSTLTLSSSSSSGCSKKNGMSSILNDQRVPVRGSFREITSSGSCKLKNDMIEESHRRVKAARRFNIDQGEEEYDINKQAEDFIKNFRNHLRIQREESFKRFQEMISRGT